MEVIAQVSLSTPQWLLSSVWDLSCVFRAWRDDERHTSFPVSLHTIHVSSFFIIPFGEKSLMHIYSLDLADYILVFFILWPRKIIVQCDNHRCALKASKVLSMNRLSVYFRSSDFDQKLQFMQCKCAIEILSTNVIFIKGKESEKLVKHVICCVNTFYKCNRQISFRWIA